MRRGAAHHRQTAQVRSPRPLLPGPRGMNPRRMQFPDNRGLRRGEVQPGRAAWMQGASGHRPRRLPHCMTVRQRALRLRQLRFRQVVIRATSGTYCPHSRIASSSQAARCSGVPPCAAAGADASAHDSASPSRRLVIRCGRRVRTFMVVAPQTSVILSYYLTPRGQIHSRAERKRTGNRTCNIFFSIPQFSGSGPSSSYAAISVHSPLTPSPSRTGIPCGAAIYRPNLET